MWRLFLDLLFDRTQPYKEKVVAFRFTPKRARTALAIIVATFLFIVFFLYFLVQLYLPKAFIDLKDRTRETRRELRALRSEHENLQQEIVNIRMGGEVDRQSVELLRKEMRDQQQELVDLRDQNALYKGMITPAELERGLVIRSWQVFSANEPNRFTFRLTLQQLTNKPAMLNGIANITLLGNQAGTPAKLQMKELLNKQEAEVLKFSFKFYQNLEATFSLPEGFEPQEWIISAGSRKPRQETDKRFAWQIESVVPSAAAELPVDNPPVEVEATDTH